MSNTYWQGAYSDHAGAVLGYLRKRVGDQAEDLLQDTFVQAIKSTGALRDENKLRAYLLTIAHNLMINRYRRTKRQGETDLEQAADVASDEPSPEEDASFSHLAHSIDRILSGMTDKQRTAFELAILRQEPYREIATITGWTLPQVKINVFRARQHFARHYSNLSQNHDSERPAAVRSFPSRRSTT